MVSAAPWTGDTLDPQFQSGCGTDCGKKPGAWPEVFDEDADEFFHTYHITSYVNEIAAAGKSVYATPMNVNVALRHPFHPGKPGLYSSGGASGNMIKLWKSAAPAIDMISPDIYFQDQEVIEAILKIYSRPDNPLFVAEVGNARLFARYFYSTLAHQGIGFVPFGMDYADYVIYPLGAKALRRTSLKFLPKLTGWCGHSLAHGRDLASKMKAGG